MRESLLEIICCTVDKADLELTADERDDDGEIVTGVLRCTSCNEEYPIEDGIPNLLPPDMRDEVSA